MEVKEFLKSNALKCLACGFIVGLVFVGLMSAMSEATGSKEFCGSCHSMEMEAATFENSSHKFQNCTECHLPHDNAINYWATKASTGITDVYHEVLRDYPARIQLSEDGRDLVNSNCLRCHQGTVSEVHTGSTENCIKCHRGIAHGSIQKEGGLKVE